MTGDGRKLVYPCVLALVLTGWSLWMTATSGWWRFGEFWQMAATMVLGSFVAGSTPAGGGAVAFPVFTKLLGVESADARTFGLMIQSVGMTMASVLILSRGIRVYWSVLRWAVPAEVSGLVVGTFWWQIGDPSPRLVFSSVAVVRWTS